MSLISAQNIASPFTNKTHLFTIILVSVLFAAFRLSGGTVKHSSRGIDGVDAPNAAYEDSEEEFDVDSEEAATPRKDLIDQMMGRDRKSATSDHSDSKGLDDIERKLGLR